MQPRSSFHQSLTNSSFAQEVNQRLLSHLISKIHLNHGQISFEKFMSQVLYAPGLGYYSGGCVKIGHSGDFVTAPELSPLFAQCLAQNFIMLIPMLPEASILEFGAGNGKMSADILMELENFNALPEQYFILEVSGDLRERQKQTLQELCPHLLPIVSWLDTLPTEGFKGLILANEVLDAMPIRRFCISDHQLYEQHVREKNQVLHIENILVPTAVLPKLPNFIHDLCREERTEDYIFEWNAHLDPWLRSVESILQQGIILIIDYGFPRHELYHPERSMGTLMCHYQHRALHDPLLNLGFQDITAHVDFTQIAETASDLGLEVLGFTNQASFLLNCGLLEMLSLNYPTLTEEDKIQQNHAVQLLTSPAEMGELFKVILLGKNYDDILGFAENDQRHRL